MFGIVLTLVAVIVVMGLAFSTCGDHPLDRGGVAAWAWEPRKK